MERSSQVAFLLATTAIFWMWQTSQPVFDKSLPFLNISNGEFHFREAVKADEKVNSDAIIVSVSELIAVFVGVATVASVYSLYSVCSDGQATFWQNMAFIILASLTSSGYGMHSACVIAQLQMTRDSELYSLLDFLHERLSHNMFQFGIFSLLILIVWVERPYYRITCTKSSGNENSLASRPAGVARNQRIAQTQYTCTGIAKTVKTMEDMGGLKRLWLKWFGPLTMGLFTAISSNRTETGGVALTFYISIIVSFILFIKYHMTLYQHSPEMSQFFDEYIVLNFFVTSAIVGLPTLFIYA